MTREGKPEAPCPVLSHWVISHALWPPQDLLPSRNIRLGKASGPGGRWGSEVLWSLPAGRCALHPGGTVPAGAVKFHPSEGGSPPDPQQAGLAPHTDLG